LQLASFLFLAINEENQQSISYSGSVNQLIMFGSFLIGILAVFAGLYIVLQSHSISSNNLTNKVVIPTVVRRDGVVFVSDGAKGIARDASIELTKLGYHVLVGVKSEEEKRSFVFESRKGLEVIIFDVADPTTLVKVVYRLRQLKRDLDRPIVGVVLNLAGAYVSF
jgi:hypothetical protein